MKNPPSQQILGRTIDFSKKYKVQTDRIGKIYRFRKSLDPFSFKNFVNSNVFFVVSSFASQVIYAQVINARGQVRHKEWRTQCARAAQPSNLTLNEED